MILYHYTCEHAAQKIAAAGMLHGSAHRMLSPEVGPLIWLTSDDTGEMAANGIAPVSFQGCDKAEFRVTVDTEKALRWAPWSRRHVHVQRRQAVETLIRGSLVASWWVILGDHPYLRIERRTRIGVWSEYTHKVKRKGKGNAAKANRRPRA